MPKPSARKQQDKTPENSRKPSMTAPAPEVKIVSQWKVACDGDGPALGHPRVWLTIPADTGFVECGYCDRRYVHESKRETVK